MKKDEDSSIRANSSINFPRSRRPFISLPQNNKKKHITNLFNISNESINNSNNDIIEDEDDEFDDENIQEKTVIEHLRTPINDNHKFFSSKNKFGKTYINTIPIKKKLSPKSKSPIIKNLGIIRHRNDLQKLEGCKKSLTTINENAFKGNDFLHCRNCMLIVALSRYGKVSIILINRFN
jgi:hypothetical protein